MLYIPDLILKYVLIRVISRITDKLVPDLTRGKEKNEFQQNFVMICRYLKGQKKGG